MKKLGIVFAVTVAIGVAAFKLFAAAGNQYNWGTQNGGAWSTPDDSKTTGGQVLQIGSSGGAVVATTAIPLTLYTASSATINALTPLTTGQISICSNCVVAPSICISSGILSSQWMLATASTTATLSQCH